jgi:hypothetical protein
MVSEPKVSSSSLSPRVFSRLFTPLKKGVRGGVVYSTSMSDVRGGVKVYYTTTFHKIGLLE